MTTQDVLIPTQQVPSPEQNTIYGWITHGRGSALVSAVAGSGKTTTLVKAGELMNGSVALVAYNKPIAEEFKKKTEHLKHIKGGTAHSFGYGIWRNACRGSNIKIDEKAKWVAIQEQIHVPDNLFGFVRSLVSFAKQAALGTYVCPANSYKFLELVEKFDLQYSLGDETTDDYDIERLVAQGIQYAQAAMIVSCDIAREIIDFDDMIYMPLKSQCRVWENDWLLVDEAQDTNASRRALYRRMLKKNGRAIFVGDPSQAIYGFTGADNDSLDLIRKDFNCIDLPLNTTFRCAKSIVSLAQTWAPHIVAHENNAEGTVSAMSEEDFTKKSAELLPSEAILCRNTRPLVGLAFSLIRRGVACHVEGKDIGRGLLVLTRKWKLKYLSALVPKLNEFMEKEIAKFLAKGEENKAASIEDKVGTLLVIAEGMPAGSTVEEFRTKIESMFEDTPAGQPATTLTLSTVHKSKGREWSKVYLLGRSKYMPSPYARQDWQKVQENNLCYVAVTRAKINLVEVSVR